MTDHLTRAPGLTDVDAITELVRAYSTAVLGFADFTAEDVRDDLTAPGFDPARDGRLVLDAHGRALGYASAHGKGESDRVEIDVVAPDPVVARPLLTWALERAAAIAGEHGHAAAVADHGAYRADEHLRSLLAAHDLAVVTTFHRMRVDHTPPVAAPETPPGLVLRHGTEPAVREAAHAVVTASFTEHFGYLAEPYQVWHDELDRKSTFDWTQLWVAELDGRPVGVLQCTDQFADDENCGYVADLGVLAAARGRGIAKFLLRHAFAIDAAAGRTGTILHVDSNNTTPALRLYESVGMRPVLVIDVWRARVPTAVGASR
ncbi:MAG TPA: GNAT family N-acetyltransferase [Actinophytocola sp.]|nr:GNAT family N-acetyltransferase [Actinophytocola sp.]